MRRALPARKPVRIRMIEEKRLEPPAKHRRVQTGDVDDFIFGVMQEKTVSER